MVNVKEESSIATGSHVNCWPKEFFFSVRAVVFRYFFVFFLFKQTLHNFCSAWPLSSSSSLLMLSRVFSLPPAICLQVYFILYFFFGLFCFHQLLLFATAPQRVYPNFVGFFLWDCSVFFFCFRLFVILSVLSLDLWQFRFLYAFLWSHANTNTKAEKAIWSM